jgi:hypothetical protein
MKGIASSARGQCCNQLAFDAGFAMAPPSPSALYRALVWRESLLNAGLTRDPEILLGGRLGRASASFRRKLESRTSSRTFPLLMARLFFCWIPAFAGMTS